MSGAGLILVLGGGGGAQMDVSARYCHGVVDQRRSHVPSDAQTDQYLYRGEIALQACEAVASGGCQYKTIMGMPCAVEFSRDSTCVGK